MGQKVNPNSFRIAYNKDWQSKWIISDKRGFSKSVFEDYTIRKAIENKYTHALISKVLIEKRDQGNAIMINIFAEKPGYLIGRGGEEIDSLITQLEFETGKKVAVNISEVNDADLDAGIVSKRIAMQLEKRMFFRKAMGDAVRAGIEKGGLGIKVMISGRVGGAEMTRVYKLQEGNIPLSTLRADIDYGFAIAKTKFGVIGVKVWVHTGSTVKKDFQRKIREQEIKEVI